MLLGLNSELENLVVMALSRSGKLTVEGLLSTITEQGKTITHQRMYRALHNLQMERVIMKEKQWYSLRLPWIIGLSRFAEELEQRYFTHAELGQLLPVGTIEKRIWRFNNLLKLVEIWMQIILAMGKQSENKFILTTAPHLWFALIHLSEWVQFKKALRGLVVKEYTLLHGTHFLDKYINALAKHPDEETYLSEEDYIESDLTIYRSVVDDLILTVRLDPATSKKIHMLFEQIKSEEDMFLLDIFQTFTSHVRITVTIKKDPRLARSYRRKFEQLFGPLNKKIIPVQP